MHSNIFNEGEKMKIYSPAGSVGRPVHGLAEAPKPLRQSNIIGLDNGKPGAAVLIQSAGQRIAQISGANWLGVRAKGSAATPVEDQLLSDLVRDADFVLTGTAD
jgi:hypothetical protein